MIWRSDDIERCVAVGADPNAPECGEGLNGLRIPAGVPPYSWPTTVPFLDPPLGGWAYQYEANGNGADYFPWYFDETCTGDPALCITRARIDDFSLKFQDAPTVGSTFTPEGIPLGNVTRFQTTLACVGAEGNGSAFNDIEEASFWWEAIGDVQTGAGLIRRLALPLDSSFVTPFEGTIEFLGFVGPDDLSAEEKGAAQAARDAFANALQAPEVALGAVADSFVAGASHPIATTARTTSWRSEAD